MKKVRSIGSEISYSRSERRSAKFRREGKRPTKEQ